MSLNLIYSFREGIIGLQRARLATTITVSIIAISLTLLGVFGVFTINLYKIVNLFKQRMTLEVFIDNSLDKNEIQSLRSKIEEIEEIENVLFVSKDEALEKFSSELGENIVNLLGENPLPASFQLKLKRPYQSSQMTAAVVLKVENIQGVDEVIYRGSFFQLIDRYSRIILIVDAGLFLFVLIATLFLIANTLRLTILSQQKTIQIMELVGARKGFIQRPYIIQGIFQGGIAGLFSLGVIWGGHTVLRMKYPGLIELPVLYLMLPFVWGLLLGFIGSKIGLRRFLRV